MIEGGVFPKFYGILQLSGIAVTSIKIFLGYEIEATVMMEAIVSGSGKEPLLRKKSANYYSLCFSLPPPSPPTSPVRRLRDTSRWPQTPGTQYPPATPHTPGTSYTPRKSIGRKQEGMASRYEVTEPSGDRGRRVTILSIDGGGVRGVIPAIILERLEALLQVCFQPDYHFPPDLTTLK